MKNNLLKIAVLALAIGLTMTSCKRKKSHRLYDTEEMMSTTGDPYALKTPALYKRGDLVCILTEPFVVKRAPMNESKVYSLMSVNNNVNGESVYISEKYLNTCDTDDVRINSRYFLEIYTPRNIYYIKGLEVSNEKTEDVYVFENVHHLAEFISVVTARDSK